MPKKKNQPKQKQTAQPKPEPTHLKAKTVENPPKTSPDVSVTGTAAAAPAGVFAGRGANRNDLE